MRCSNDDDGERKQARHRDGSDDDDDGEMEEAFLQAATHTRSGRQSKKRIFEDAATVEEQQQEINADKQSRKKHKLNRSIIDRQMRILQSSGGEKSLCTRCAGLYADLEHCDCHRL